jgi:hypothetical protein
MGTIAVRFEGLCYFFLDELMKNGKIISQPELRVGLVEVNNKTKIRLPGDKKVPSDDYHDPTIIISEISREPGTSLRIKPKQFKSVSGDIFLDAPQAPSGIRLYNKSMAGKMLTDYIATRDNKNVSDPLGFRIIRFDRDLYPGTKLKGDPDRCRARFHCRNGVLFSMMPFDIKYGVPDENNKGEAKVSRQNMPIKTGLEITLSEGERAYLYFSKSKEVFVFRGDTDYEIVVSSLSANSRKKTKRNHFLYYYSIFPKPPAELYAPLEPGSGWVGHPENNPYCSNFGGGG